MLLVNIFQSWGETTGDLTSSQKKKKLAELRALDKEFTKLHNVLYKMGYESHYMWENGDLFWQKATGTTRSPPAVRTFLTGQKLKNPGNRGS